MIIGSYIYKQDRPGRPDVPLWKEGVDVDAVTGKLTALLDMLYDKAADKYRLGTDILVGKARFLASIYAVFVECEIFANEENVQTYHEYLSTHFSPNLITLRNKINDNIRVWRIREVKSQTRQLDNSTKTSKLAHQRLIETIGLVRIYWKNTEKSEMA